MVALTREAAWRVRQAGVGLEARRERRDVEWLAHWAYSTEWAASDVAEGRGGGSPLARIGMAVDGGGAGGRCNDDALEVVIAVHWLGALGRIVARYAIAGSRPDWRPGARMRVVPVMRPWRGQMRPVVEYDANRNPVLCFVTVLDRPEDLEPVRQVWTQWHEGLTRLAARLAGRLRDWDALPPAAPRAPWELADSVPPSASAH